MRYFSLKCPYCGEQFIGESNFVEVAENKAREKENNHKCSKKPTGQIPEKGPRGGERETTVKKDSPRRKWSSGTKRYF